MAMNAEGMATMIVENMKALNPEISGSQEAEMVTYWTAICEGIIGHMSANAVTTVENVQPGTGTASGGIA